MPDNQNRNPDLNDCLFFTWMLTKLLENISLKVRSQDFIPGGFNLMVKKIASLKGMI